MLYRIVYDARDDYVEVDKPAIGSALGAAVAAWHEAMKAEHGDDWFGDEEPDSVVLEHEEPVIRGKGIR